MNSTDLKELDNPSLSLDQRALLQCRIVSELIHTGQYNEARKVLGGLWQGTGERPNLTGLKTITAAEVLLQCGILSRWLGSIRQLPVQEKAKDLIFEAYRKFKSQGQHSKVSEAQYELGMCYFRLGAYDESRIVLDEAQTLAETLGETDLKARILIRKTLVEIWTGCYHEALEILKEAREFFESCNDIFRGKWHSHMGLVLRRLAAIESNAHYYDRAIIEYTAAAYHCELAHHEQYCAVNLTNLAFLFYKIGRYEEAHENLNQAVKILTTSVIDNGLLSSINETRARIFVAEKRYKEADKVISEAIKILEQGGQTALLADSLTTRGVIWSRLGEHKKSIGILRDAMNLAMDAGSSCNAAHAALSLLEEHIERLSNIELYEIYHRANELLKSTQDAEDLKRLRQVSSAIMKRLLGPQLGDKDFNLTNVVHKYEASFIEEALERASGIVTRAAKLLGFKHHGSLTSLLKRRHKNLAPKRTPPQQRRRYSLGSRSKALFEVKKRKATILYVEDNLLVSSAVKETFECEGWNVEVYADGLSALKQIESQTPYDIFLIDYELPDITGIEIIRKIKKLPHRKHVPIIMFTASGFLEEAQQAGADVFLKKPEDIYSLVESVNQLLQNA
jgi:CheY-like chemotaxis protein